MNRAHNKVRWLFLVKKDAILGKEAELSKVRLESVTQFKMRNGKINDFHNLFFSQIVANNDAFIIIIIT